MTTNLSKCIRWKNPRKEDVWDNYNFNTNHSLNMLSRANNYVINFNKRNCILETQNDEVKSLKLLYTVLFLFLFCCFSRIIERNIGYNDFTSFYYLFLKWSFFLLLFILSHSLSHSFLSSYLNCFVFVIPWRKKVNWSVHFS